MLAASTRRSVAAGASLVDVMFAIALVAFASAALFVLYSNALQLLQSQQETRAATLCLQERVEKLRGSNWDTLTGSSALQAILASQPISAGSLPSVVEDITVSAYPPPSPAKPLQVRRTAAGALTLVTQNTALGSAPALRVDARVSWTRRGRTHIRENSLILAQGGLIK